MNTDNNHMQHLNKLLLSTRKIIDNVIIGGAQKQDIEFTQALIAAAKLKEKMILKKLEQLNQQRSITGVD